MPLELTFHVEPDEHGVIDGRELARQLIGSAFLLLTPYAQGCPACSDTLFTVIANTVMERVHAEGRAEGRLEGTFFRPGPADDEATARHFAAAEATTQALLEKADAEPHHH